MTYGRNGYNATKGGTILYDHNEIVELYNLGYSTGQIASKLNCDISTIQKVLKSKGIKSRVSYSRLVRPCGKLYTNI